MSTPIVCSVGRGQGGVPILVLTRGESKASIDWFGRSKGLNQLWARQLQVTEPENWVKEICSLLKVSYDEQMSIQWAVLCHQYEVELDRRTGLRL